MAFLTLCVASIISTVTLVKATNAINKYGKVIGISASKGSEFLGMTWASVVVVLLASISWVVIGVNGRSKHEYREKGRY